MAVTRYFLGELVKSAKNRPPPDFLVQNTDSKQQKQKQGRCACTRIRKRDHAVRARAAKRRLSADKIVLPFFVFYTWGTLALGSRGASKPLGTGGTENTPAGHGNQTSKNRRVRAKRWGGRWLQKDGPLVGKKVGGIEAPTTAFSVVVDARLLEIEPETSSKFFRFALDTQP